MSATKYVIEWSCECGASGEIVGQDVHDAWRQFELIREDHKDHNIFSRMEYEEERE